MGWIVLLHLPGIGHAHPTVLGDPGKFVNEPIVPLLGSAKGLLKRCVLLLELFDCEYMLFQDSLVILILIAHFLQLPLHEPDLTLRVLVIVVLRDKPTLLLLNLATKRVHHMLVLILTVLLSDCFLLEVFDDLDLLFDPGLECTVSLAGRSLL